MGTTFRYLYMTLAVTYTRFLCWCFNPADSDAMYISTDEYSLFNVIRTLHHVKYMFAELEIQLLHVFLKAYYSFCSPGSLCCVLTVVLLGIKIDLLAHKWH